MLLTSRRILLALAVLVVLAGLGVLIVGSLRLGAGLAAAGAVVAVVAALLPASGHTRGPVERDDLSDVSPDRLRELFRGTSLFLREARYRYSVRFDARRETEQRNFTAEVNGVRLGFVPAVITDNTTDRQGFGYVAFVYDGHRWRGLGLPCPADQAEAVQHAARCVSPLATKEETHFGA